ncbi:MAG: hypothetical protein JST51_11570 [Armatimonadetes bacterium]|nr:hypothetical protein [Armatimonadota bacterium]
MITTKKREVAWAPNNEFDVVIQYAESHLDIGQSLSEALNNEGLRATSTLTLGKSVAGLPEKVLKAPVRILIGGLPLFLDEKGHHIYVSEQEPPVSTPIPASVVFHRYRLGNADDIAAIAARVRQLADIPTGIDESKLESYLRAISEGLEDERYAVLKQIEGLTYDERLSVAERLADFIDHILGRMAPDQPPTELPGRMVGWLTSCLGAADIESPATRAILQRCLELPYGNTPSVTIKYWALACLIKHHASYRRQLVERLDTGVVELMLLATYILGMPFEPSVQNMLMSSAVLDQYGALRALRIVPVPIAALQIGRYLADYFENNSPLLYDALYACSQREMADQVAALPQVLDQIPAVVRNVLTIAQTDKALRRFCRILSFLPPDKVQIVLENERANFPEKVDKVLKILDGEEVEKHSSPNQRHVFATLSNDSTDAEDALNVRLDAEVFAAVVTATQLTPPLAIGLFGAWGTGKSFFMKEMQAAIDRRVKDSRNRKSNVFHHNVVQIEFNAWHYNDANLWASLVHHIFKKLDEHVSPPETVETKQKRLESELAQAEGNSESLARQIESLALDLKAKQDQAGRLQLERLNRKVDLRELTSRDFIKLIDNPKLRDEANKSMKELGIDSLVKSVDDLHGALRDIGSLRGELKTALLKLTKWPQVALVIVVLAGIPVLIYLIPLVTNTLGRAGLTFGGTAALLTAPTLMINQTLKKVRSGIEVLNNARAKVDEVIQQKLKDKTEEEETLEKAIDEELNRLQDMKAQQAAEEEKIQTAKKELHTLREENSLRYFIAKRLESDDYRKHLGLISTIRDDFNVLQDRLAKKEGEKSVDRIVLYIDDLDRCSSQKVVEVLQAVHLLLAFQLFVVVVGVDPKWLMHSLTDNYSQFVSHDKEDSESDSKKWRTSPASYLEKVFQIPFRLKPMKTDGYGKMVANLFGDPPPIMVRAEAAASLSVEGAADGVTVREDDQPPAPTAEAEQTEAPPRPPVETLEEPKEDIAAPVLAVVAEPEVPEVQITESALLITRQEVAFAQTLSPLIANPRALKRFTNIYRILKAPLAESEIGRYEGTEQKPGEFRVPMLLLAILVGSPEAAKDLMPMLKQALKEGKSPTTSIRAYFASNPSEAGHFVRELIHPRTFPKDSELYRTWLPQVCRFSFETGQLID